MANALVCAGPLDPSARGRRGRRPRTKGPALRIFITFGGPQALGPVSAERNSTFITNKPLLNRQRPRNVLKAAAQIVNRQVREPRTCFGSPPGAMRLKVGETIPAINPIAAIDPPPAAHRFRPMYFHLPTLLLLEPSVGGVNAGIL